MAEDATIRCWADPRDYSVRFFVGDDLGNIRLNYADGTTQIYPLVLGESFWFGQPFYRLSRTFPNRRAICAKLWRQPCGSYPPAPVEDGNYISVIKPKCTRCKASRWSAIQQSGGRQSSTALRLKPANSDELARAESPLCPGRVFRGFREIFTGEAAPRSRGRRSRNDKPHWTLFATLFIQTTNISRAGCPRENSGWIFRPGEYPLRAMRRRRFLANAFRYNVQDIADKVDAEGMYHTSTKGATCWNGNGFGTFRTNAADVLRDFLVAGHGTQPSGTGGAGLYQRGPALRRLLPAHRMRLWEDKISAEIQRTVCIRRTGAGLPTGRARRLRMKTTGMAW